jgi:hypothetical protein
MVQAAGRLGAYLSGKSSDRLLAGLTFVSPEVVSTVVPESTSAAACLLAATESLALDFVFVPAEAAWAPEFLAKRGECGAMWVVEGPLWPAMRSRGDVADGLRDTVRDPAAILREIDVETERAAWLARRGIELGADAVVIAEDLAGTAGLLVTKDFALRELMPRLSSIVARAVRGRPAILHSDGDIRSLLPQIARAGFFGVHAGGGLDRDSYEQLFWDVRSLGMLAVGGIQTEALGRGAYSAVKAGTRAAALAHGGGLLLADDGGITNEEQLVAFLAAVEAARGGKHGGTA